MRGMTVTVHEPEPPEGEVPGLVVTPPDPDYSGWSDEDVAAEAAKATAEHRRRQAVVAAQVDAARALVAHQAARGISDGTEWTEPAGYLDAVPPGGARVWHGDLYENTSGGPVVHSPGDAPQLWTLIAEGVSPVVPDPADHPEWAQGVDYAVGDVVTYDGELWECTFEHRSQAGWEPAPGYMWRRP